MHDQADELRELVRQLARRTAGDATPRPALVVVAGAKGGVGTTTTAVNLAVALAQQRRRVVLADADPEGAGVGLLCRTPRRLNARVAPVHRPVIESLEPGPAGVQLLPGTWGLADAWESSSSVQERLIDSLLGLGGAADWVIADAGDGSGRMARRLWRAADTVLLVTTAENPSVMNAYASIKVLAAGDDALGIRILANMADASAADDVVQRLGRACLRFLGLKPQPAGFVPDAPELAEAARRGQPVVLAAPRSPAAKAFVRLAETLAEDQCPARAAQLRLPESKTIEEEQEPANTTQAGSSAGR